MAYYKESYFLKASSVIKMQLNKMLKSLPVEFSGFGKMRMGAATVLILKIFGMVLGYVFTVLIARLYGPDVLGNFLSAFLIVEVALVISVSGMNTAVLSLTSRFNTIAEDRRRYYVQFLVLAKSCLFSIPVSLVCTILLYAAADYISRDLFHSIELKEFLRIMALGILPVAISRQLLQYFRGKNKVIRFAILNYLMLNSGFLLFLPVMKLYYSNDLAVPASYLASAFLLAAVSLIILFLQLTSEKRSLSPVNAAASAKIFTAANIMEYYHEVPFTKLNSIARPMLFADIMDFAKTWMGTFFVGLYLSQYYVGIYGISLKLASAVGLIALAINVVAMPRFGEYYGKNDKAAIQKLLSETSRYMFILTGIAVACIILLGSLVLNLIRSDYGMAFDVLLILSISPLISAFIGSGFDLLQVINKQRIYGVILGINTIIALLMYNYFIPEYGLIGAAVTEVIFSMFVTISLLIYLKSGLNLNPCFKLKNHS